jgi:anti-anti-sigma factor
LLSITKQVLEGELIISLKGVIDLTTVGQLAESVGQEIELNNTISFDLSQVELIDSTGIGYILRAILYYRSQNKSVQMINIPEMIEDTFEIMGVNQILGMGHHV